MLTVHKAVHSPSKYLPTCVPMMVILVLRNAEFTFIRKDIVLIIKLLTNNKMNDRKNVNVAVV